MGRIGGGVGVGVGGVMKHYEQVDRAHRGRRIPLISPPPLSWRDVYREGEWGKSYAGDFEGGGLDPDGEVPGSTWDLLCDDLNYLL